ncbi:unnamed protein product [Acanthoscelides obtectus]|uniref:Ig-like domain-containing protein n=1 Tax=Acanthoscelides obtectus TaxID=200917 RepID=A0A9P0MAW4_ACAOB|nr:unnamed protein product [Acanthoscelides obtectus]CAK1645229.1 hypothetical protein AOBTE_LOCUS14065 [Acanthoscelides obtectus]
MKVAFSLSLSHCQQRIALLTYILHPFFRSFAISIADSADASRRQHDVYGAVGLRQLDASRELQHPPGSKSRSTAPTPGKRARNKPYFKEELLREELPNRTLGSASSGKLYVADNEIYIEDGELVNLTCEVQAEPGAKFDWFAVDRNNRTKKLGNALTR